MAPLRALLLLHRALLYPPRLGLCKLPFAASVHKETRYQAYYLLTATRGPEALGARYSKRGGGWTQKWGKKPSAVSQKGVCCAACACRVCSRCVCGVANEH